LPGSRLDENKQKQKTTAALKRKGSAHRFLRLTLAKRHGRDECTGTSVTLWTGDMRYKSLAELRACIEVVAEGISKECGKGGKP